MSLANAVTYTWLSQAFLAFLPWGADPDVAEMVSIDAAIVAPGQQSRETAVTVAMVVCSRSTWAAPSFEALANGDRPAA